MEGWTASIAYDEKNTLRLSKTLFNVFHLKQKMILFLLCAIMIAGGFLVGMQKPSGLFSLFAGCVLLVNTDAAARKQARDITKGLKGYVPTMRYTFYDDGFQGTTANEDHRFAYKDLIRISDDGRFWYLFRDQQSAFMIDASTLEPKSAAAFKQHLEKNVGLEWTSCGRLLGMGVLTLIHDIRNTRKPHNANGGE